jgi:DNA-binding CsgD family transcriptional regulator
MSLQSRSGWRWLGTAGFDPAPTAIMTRHYGDSTTNLMVAVMGRLRPTIATARQAALSDDEYFGSGLYNDVFRPQGLVHAAVACAYRSGDRFAPLGVFRDVRREEFGADELKMLSFVLPHLARSIEIYRRIGTLLERERHFELALDSLPFGVIFVDVHGLVWKANSAAETVIRRNDGLTVRGKRLQAASPAQNRELQRAIGTAFGESCGAVLKISRPSARRAYSMLVLPLPVANAAGDIKSGAVLFLTDADRRRRPSAQVLGQLFDLTPAQAELLSELIAGRSMPEAAAAIGIKPATARTHLKAILQRTGTHRQSELTRLVMESPAVLQSAPHSSAYK